jgi:hypothetical protein
LKGRSYYDPEFGETFFVPYERVTLRAWFWSTFTTLLLKVAYHGVRKGRR